MAKPGSGLTAERVVGGVLAAGFLLMLAANLPGHMSYDSVAQLYEGHFHVRETWGPVLYAWLLGFFDGIIPGTAAYVTVSGLLLFLSLASFTGLRGRCAWIAVPVALAVVLTPQVLIYQAIVWKDVMFANTAIAGMVCLAHALRDWARTPRRWMWLAAALLMLAVASLVRQNGIVVTAVAALSLGWVAARGRWWRGGLWGAGGFIAVFVLSQVLTAAAMPAKAPPDDAMNRGVRIVQNYDLVGAVALDPSYPLSQFTAADHVTAALIRARSAAHYSGERVDFVDRDSILGNGLWAYSADVVNAQWLDLVIRHPTLYARVRFEDFRWVFASPIIDRCLPVYVGVDAPAFKLDPLKIKPRRTKADQELANYATWYLDTPAYSHVTYAALALVIGVLLLLRRNPADLAMAGLMFAALGFAASFFIISIACDYRYLYFTDLAALAGALYLATDVRGIFRRGTVEAV